MERLRDKKYYSTSTGNSRNQVFSNAGHGFGLRKNNKGPVSQWLQRFVEWINDTVFK